MYDIPLTRPYFGPEELEEIKKVLDSGWVSQGPKVKEFEQNVADYLGVEHAIAVTNCTAALHLALLSLEIGHGDEVIVADYTFPATGHAVMYCGARPVFADIDPQTYNVDSDLIEEKITPRTRAIIPVHTFGQPAAMDPILEIAEAHDLAVIEDAACALGAKYKGRYAGTIGDVGCFSFHARKGITTGEGGMIVTNRSDVANKVRHLSVFGMHSVQQQITGLLSIPQFIDLGFNYKMSDITAAIGIVQLSRLDDIIKRKIELANYYDKRLIKIKGIRHPYINKDTFSIYQSYVALVDGDFKRDDIIQSIAQCGIQTQIGTYASHIQPLYKSKDTCHQSKDVYCRALALPMFYTLSEAEIDYVCHNLQKILEEEYAN